MRCLFVVQYLILVKTDLICRKIESKTFETISVTRKCLVSALRSSIDDKIYINWMKVKKYVHKQNIWKLSQSECFGKSIKETHLFALDYIKTWLRSHRCSSGTQIRTARQNSTVKQEDPVWKFLSENAHFIRTIWCSLPFFGVGTAFPHLFFSTTLCFTT